MEVQADMGRDIMERTRELEKAVYPTRRPLARGMQSVKGKNLKALTWKCPKCGKVNQPERRRLAIMPIIICTCGEEAFADDCGGYFAGQSSGSLLGRIKKYYGSPINPGRSEALGVA